MTMFTYKSTSVLTTILQLMLVQAIAQKTVSNYTELVIPGFSSCYSKGHHYKIGETFHPKINFDGKDLEAICILCTCNPTTILQCVKSECPTLNCKVPIRLEGECCDKCPEDLANLSGVELKTLQSEPHNCVLDGFIYEHNSTFHPSKANLSVTEWPFCTSITCKNGTLVYSDVSATCPAIMACDKSQAFHVEGSCCKVCPEIVLKDGECKDELGNPRKFNETWHFYSSYYQTKISCLNCSCMGSSYTCVKDPCPTVPMCTGEEELEEVQLCCPKCSNIPPPKESTPTVEVVLTVCPHTHRVYLCNSTSMAIETVKDKNVTMYVWLSSNVKQVFIYSSAEFQKLSCSDPKHYKGGAKEIRVKGLQNRPSKRKQIQECTEQNYEKCADLVVRMLRVDDSC